MTWYNKEHKHSQLNYVTTQERHKQQDNAVLMQRKKVLEEAKAKNPIRWSGEIRSCDPVGDVMLNPDNDNEKEKNTFNAA